MIQNYPSMYQDFSSTNQRHASNSYYVDDDRFFLAPFLLGGVAGTALGYGIANNNQMNNNQGYYPVYPVYPFYYNYPVYPTTYSNSNNYYY